MHARKVCVESRSREFFHYLDREFFKSGKTLLNVRVHHSGNFVPWEITRYMVFITCKIIIADGTGTHEHDDTYVATIENCIIQQPLTNVYTVT